MKSPAVARRPFGQQNDERLNHAPDHLSQVVNAGFNGLNAGSLSVDARSLSFDFRSDLGGLGFQFREARIY